MPMSGSQWMEVAGVALLLVFMSALWATIRVLTEHLRHPKDKLKG
jgi:hypothetical protein